MERSFLKNFFPSKDTSFIIEGFLTIFFSSSTVEKVRVFITQHNNTRSAPQTAEEHKQQREAEIQPVRYS